MGLYTSEKALEDVTYLTTAPVEWMKHTSKQAMVNVGHFWRTKGLESRTSGYGSDFNQLIHLVEALFETFNRKGVRPCSVFW